MRPSTIAELAEPLTVTDAPPGVAFTTKEVGVPAVPGSDQVTVADDTPAAALAPVGVAGAVTLEYPMMVAPPAWLVPTAMQSVVAEQEIPSRAATLDGMGSVVQLDPPSVVERSEVPSTAMQREVVGQERLVSVGELGSAGTVHAPPAVVVTAIPLPAPTQSLAEAQETASSGDTDGLDPAVHVAPPSVLVNTARVARFPTIMQSSGDPHDTAVSVNAPEGRVPIVHDVPPFDVVSTSDAPMATHRVDVGQETAISGVMANPGSMSDHLAPPSMVRAMEPAPPVGALPTAMHRIDDGQETAAKWGSVEGVVAASHVAPRSTLYHAVGTALVTVTH